MNRIALRRCIYAEDESMGGAKCGGLELPHSPKECNGWEGEGLTRDRPPVDRGGHTGHCIGIEEQWAKEWKGGGRRTTASDAAESRSNQIYTGRGEVQLNQ